MYYKTSHLFYTKDSLLSVKLHILLIVGWLAQWTSVCLRFDKDHIHLVNYDEWVKVLEKFFCNWQIGRHIAEAEHSTIAHQALFL